MGRKKNKYIEKFGSFTEPFIFFLPFYICEWHGVPLFSSANMVSLGIWQFPMLHGRVWVFIRGMHDVKRSHFPRLHSCHQWWKFGNDQGKLKECSETSVGVYWIGLFSECDTD